MKLTTNDSDSVALGSTNTLTVDGSNQELNQTRKSNASQLYVSQNTLKNTSNQQLDETRRSESSKIHGSSQSLASHRSNRSLNTPKKPEKFTSVGNLNVIDDNENDSDDDIDGTFEAAKLVS